MIKKISLYLLVFFSSLALAEDLPDSSLYDNASEELPSKEYRPELGVGLGYYYLFSDVQGASSRSVFAGPMVYSVYAARRISRSLDFGLRFSTGGMVASEIGPDRYLNFKTILHGGSAYIAYDFSHLFPATAVLKPYLSFGLSVFEFNNKGDLYDANGNFYHYWSDGTIRNLNETATNAAESAIIQRDYVYETDLRKADLDGFGRYRQVGFGIPVGLEFEFNVNKRVSFRLGSIFTYSMTDLLDNVTENSVGNRQGKKGGDHFFQHKLSLHYDLFNKRRKIKVEEFEFVDYLAMDVADEDKDGIINEFDLCPFTIKDIQVDQNGCPMDVDGDTIPDYMDLENFSEVDADVNDVGITYTDEDYLLWYMTFIDSLDVNPAILERIAQQKRELLPKYRVFLKEYDQGELISDAEVETWLKEKDVRVFNTKEGKTVYTAGEYLRIADARQHQNELIENGVEDAQVIVMDDNEMMSAEDWKELSDRQIKDRFKNEFKKVDALEGFYAVLLGTTDAGASNAEKSVYLKEQDVLMLDGNRKSMNYVKGPFIDTVAASQNVEELKKKGFRDAKIVKVINGRVQELSEETTPDELALEMGDYKKLIAHDGKLVVKVGTLTKNSTALQKAKFSKEDGLISIANSDKSIDFVYEIPYISKQEAVQKREEFKQKGFEDAKVATVVVDDQDLKLIVEDELDGHFVISLGTFDAGVPNDEVNKILSISDVKKLPTYNPDKNTYVVGKFATKEAAKQRMENLIDQGFSPSIIEYKDDEISNIDESQIIDPALISKKNTNKGGEVQTQKAVFRVQVGAFSKEVPLSKFKGMDVVDFKNEKGVIKYVSGGQNSYRDAYIEKLKLQEVGFKDAFVVAYKDGKQIPIKDLVNDAEFKQVKDEFAGQEQAGINEIRYKVQVGAFKDFSSQHNKIRTFPNIEMEVYGDYKRILTGNYKTYQEALKLKKAIASKGYPNAFVVAYSGSKRMSLDQVDTQVIDESEKTPSKVVVDENLHLMVQLGLYKGALPAEVQERMDKVAKITKEISPEGITRYMAGDFSDPTAATAYKEEMKKLGFKGVFLVAYYKNEKIDIKRALEIYEQGR